MKCLRLFLFLCFLGVNSELPAIITTGLVTSPGTEELRQLIGPTKDNNNKFKQTMVAGYARKYGIELKDNEEDVTNEENFVYPCDYDDLHCIRQFLVKNSKKCKPVRGLVPDPWCLAQSTAFYPSTNLSLTLSNYETFGLSRAKVIGFFHNKKTRKVVLTFKVNNVTEKAPKACFGYKRVGKETIYKCDYLNVNFKSVIITVTLTKLPNICLEHSEVSVHITGGTPMFEIGPDAITSDDPTVQATYEALLTSIPILVREYFLFRGQLWALKIIQSVLVDCGVEIISL